MPKRPMQDIVPGNSRSIRNIPVPEHRRTAPQPDIIVNKSSAPVRRAPVRPTLAPKSPRQVPVPAPDPVMDVQETPSYEPTPDRETLRSVRQEFESHTETRIKQKGRGKKYLVIGSAVIGVVALALVVSSVFHAATITVTPRSEDVTLNEGVTSVNSPVANAVLPFTPLTVNTIGSQKVAAAGEEKVDKAATGTIIIYNNYNANTQRLVKNTRFETPEGLIYRITDSVTVPGKKGTVPGSVEATVVAEATGDKYNVGLKDFTIPGFKNDPRYTTFYARSKTPLAGGFTGTVKVVADADRLKAQNDIKAAATTELLEKVQAEKPAGSVFFGNAYTVDCSPLPQETVSDKEAMIKMDCALSAALFDMQQLAAFVANKYVTGYGNEAIVINNLADLTFTPKAGFAPGTSSSISFTLTGPARLEWTYDETALKAALAGKKRAEVPSVLQAYPMIQKADISVRPAWRRSLPAEAKDISITKVI